jgi:Nif-specific regulatory protein
MISQTYSGPERREHARIRRSFLVECRLHDDQDGSRVIDTVDAWAYDLSPRGMRLYTFGSLPCSQSYLKGKRLACRFPQDAGSDAWFIGQVIWLESSEPSHGDEQGQPFYLGVSFASDRLAGAYIERLITLHPVPSHPTIEELSSLLEVSHYLTAAIDLDDLLRLILVTVNRLMRSRVSSLLLVDPVTNELFFKVPLGPASRQLKEIRLKPGQGIAGWVVKEGKPLLVNDVEQDPRFDPQIDTLTGFKTRSILAVPLQDRERIIGAIEVLNTAKEKQFTQKDVELLSAFAAHAAVALRNAQLVSTIKAEKRYLQGELDEQYRTLIGTSPLMQETIRTARTVADAHVTVLLLGETGVGKEIIARSIHAWSSRAQKPFMALNCAAISEHLLESELFGHEKGAFTGAHQQKKGLFEFAHGGTVFLDEIGDMKPDLQAKLLRVLQDHTFERVGGTHPIQVDIRIIAATNQDLAASVQSGRFRKDLFFRLNVVSIRVPPLRERREDIPALAGFFMERYCREMKRAPMAIEPEAMGVLRQYDWPGNVRELENVIERAVVLTPGKTIGPKDLLQGIASSATYSPDALLDLPFLESAAAHKRALIQHAIAKAGGSKSKAAQALKLQPSYLSRLCKQLGIT